MPNLLLKNCKHKAENGHKTYHFPTDLTKRTKWYSILEEKKLDYPKRTSNPVLCVCHFNEL
jgi:hypothetical protein